MTQTQVKTALFRHIHELRLSLGISKTLGQAHVRSSEIPDLARKAMNDACILTNPRKAITLNFRKK